MKIKNVLLIAVLASGIWTQAAETLPPIACNMKALTAEQRKQLNETGEHVIGSIVASRDLKDGYAFQVDAAKSSITEVAQWLDLWRRCCPFYEFRIDFHAADAGLWLSVTGRPGVKEFLPKDSARLAEKLPK